MRQIKVLNRQMNYSNKRIQNIKEINELLGEKWNSWK